MSVPGTSHDQASAKDLLSAGIGRALLLLSAALAMIVPALAWFEPDLPGRALLAVLFAVAGPGVPLAIALVPSHRVLWAVLGPAVSASALVLVALVQVITPLWSPPATATVLGLLTLVSTPWAWSRLAPLPPGIRVSGWALRKRGIRGAVPMGAVIVVLLVAMVMWTIAVRTVDLDAAGAAGLLPVAPVTYWIALALIIVVAVFALGWMRGIPQQVALFMTAAALVVATTTFVSTADGGAVAGTSYVHMGFVDVIAERGGLLGSYDARFSWPGFFAAAAVVLQWSGADSVAGALVPYPAVIGILLILPLHLLGRAITGRADVAWLGVLLFSLGNWVQQDYFSPQSFALVLYVSVIGVLLWQTSHAEVPAASGSLLHRIKIAMLRTPSRAWGLSGRQTIGLEGVLVVLIAALTVSHQLTPVALMVSLVLLAATGTIRSRTLWLGAAVLFASWFLFGATDWWRGNLSILINGLGQTAEAIESGVSARIAGDPQHQLLQQARIGWSALIAAVAVVGWVLSRRTFPLSATTALIVAPVSLVLGQSYGGEVVLRVYLYALPILAVLCARALFAAVGRGPRPLALAALTLVLFGAAAALTATRGANTAFERNPADAVAAASALLDEAPTGARIWPLWTDGTLRQDRIPELRSAIIDPAARDSVSALQTSRADYIVLTTPRQAYEEIRAGADRDSFVALARRLVLTGDYRILSRSDHSTILERVR